MKDLEKFVTWKNICIGMWWWSRPSCSILINSIVGLLCVTTSAGKLPLFSLDWKYIYLSLNLYKNSSYCVCSTNSLWIGDVTANTCNHVNTYGRWLASGHTYIYIYICMCLSIYVCIYIYDVNYQSTVYIYKGLLQLIVLTEHKYCQFVVHQIYIDH